MVKLSNLPAPPPDLDAESVYTLYYGSREV